MDSPEEGTCGQSETSRFARRKKRGAAAREKEERKRARERESVAILVCEIYKFDEVFFRVGRVKVVHEIHGERGKSREEYLVNHARNHTQKSRLALI